MCDFLTSNLRFKKWTELTCHTCFAPQRCAIFRDRNIKNCSGPECFAHFGLQICFAPQPRAIFLRSELQKWLRECGLLCILTWKMCFAPQPHAITPFFDIGTSKMAPSLRCFLYILTRKFASRHSGVPFFMSQPNSNLRSRRFSDPTFRTSGTTNH